MKEKRLISVDRFRGLCIFFMACQGMIEAFGDTFASWEKLISHDADGIQIFNGISFADIFAPCFIFIVGMMLVKSFNSRKEKYGTKKAYVSLASRFLAIIGVGAVLDGLDKAIGVCEDILEEGSLSLSSFFASVFGHKHINVRVYILVFMLVVLLLLILLITKLIKNDKLSIAFRNIVRYVLIALGVFTIYSICAWHGEDISAFYTGQPLLSWSIGTKVWSTLENIGLAGLLALPFVSFKKEGKLVMVIAILFVMTPFISHGGIFTAERVIEGGFYGAFGWACILLLGSYFFELDQENNKKSYWLTVVALLAFVIIFGLIFKMPAAKRGCTPVFVAYTSIIAALLYKGFKLLDKFELKFDLLRTYGSNSIVVYCLHIILSTIVMFIIDSTGATFSVPVGLVFVAISLVLYFVPAYLLQRNGKHIRA